MKEIRIIGKISDDEFAKAHAFLIQDKEKGLQRMPGESRKTPQERRFLRLIRGYIQQEFAELGFEAPRLNQRQFHFFNSASAKEHFQIPGDVSHIDNMASSVVMNKDEFHNRLEFFFAVLHEGLHLVSYEAYHPYIQEWPVASYRSGYMVSDYRGNQYHEHLRKFNEGVVDTYAGEIMGKHWDELVDTFGFTQREVDAYERRYRDGRTGYGVHREMVLSMVSEIARYRSEPYETTWQRFKKGLFTGHMMHLRDIDYVFGRGQLQVVSR